MTSRDKLWFEMEKLFYLDAFLSAFQQFTCLSFNTLAAVCFHGKITARNLKLGWEIHGVVYITMLASLPA